MSPSRARYVTACQQLLALGVVVIALVPATRVVSLDVVGVRPGQGVAQPTISVSHQADAWPATRERQHAVAGRSPRVAEREAGPPWVPGRSGARAVSRSGG